MPTVSLQPCRVDHLRTSTDAPKEVTQQSKARHKDDFLHAFAPVIAEACAVAYKGTSADVQAKLRRVIDVWKERGVFEPAIQQAVEARLGGKSSPNAGLHINTQVSSNI